MGDEGAETGRGDWDAGTLVGGVNFDEDGPGLGGRCEGGELGRVVDEKGDRETDVEERVKFGYMARRGGKPVEDLRNNVIYGYLEEGRKNFTSVIWPSWTKFFRPRISRRVETTTLVCLPSPSIIRVASSHYGTCQFKINELR